MRVHAFSVFHRSKRAVESDKGTEQRTVRTSSLWRNLEDINPALSDNVGDAYCARGYKSHLIMPVLSQ